MILQAITISWGAIAFWVASTILYAFLILKSNSKFEKVWLILFLLIFTFCYGMVVYENPSI